MIGIDEDILESLAHPFIMTDDAGKIIKINEPAEMILQRAGVPASVFLSEIAKLFQLDAGNESGFKAIRVGNLRHKVRKITIHLDQGPIGRGTLYLFEMPDILKKMDFDTLLDYIDESIVIANPDGVIDHVNRIFNELTGFAGRKGFSLKVAVERGDMQESIAMQTVKSGKTEKMNVQFKTGKTLTFTSIPFFGRNGEIEKIINTGRDVTKLIELQDDLQKTEGLKDHYYNRLSTLESLVGTNTIVHSSDKMKRVVSLAAKAAKSDSPIFIWGESGVGKELIADLIHKSSDRNKRPFVGINCSAIPSELLEAEFFGYEEGAFTGAKKGGKKGLFEEAKNGTLFLDEITEIPFAMQSKLLRVLQEREFIRVGGTKPIPLNARIISSSNLDKDQLADPVKFRRDLFYRLNVIPVFIPPLRERREDILPLVRFFLQNMNLKYNTNSRISLNLLVKFHNYDWPGNIRELKNIIERLVVTADKDEVTVEDYRAISQFEERNAVAGDEDIAVSRLMTLETAFQRVEEILLKKAFKEAGNITKTAEILGIDPSTIHRKIKKGLIRLK